MTPEQLIDRAVELFGIQRGLILSPCRSAPVVTARYAVIWALRQNGWTVEGIGAFLGRDHTTICYALDVAESRCGSAALEQMRVEIIRAAPTPPIDWKARVAQLEARIAELEAVVLGHARRRAA